MTFNQVLLDVGQLLHLVRKSKIGSIVTIPSPNYVTSSMVFEA
jgi:hypothetical protein